MTLVFSDFPMKESYLVIPRTSISSEILSWMPFRAWPTNIRLLHQFFKGDTLHFSCISLTLHRQSSTDTVLPMTIDRHDIANVDHGWFGKCSDPGERYVESSDDGHARGFSRFFAPYDVPRPLNNPIMQFIIDASRDRCVAVLGQILIPQWRQIDDPRRTTSILFDGVRGRLYYDRWRAFDEVGKTYQTSISLLRRARSPPRT